MTEQARRTLGMVLLLALTASGCSGDGPSLVSLTGKVTEKGQPIEGAAVMFMPTVDGKETQPAQDTTGPDGSFKLLTDGRTGAVPGPYAVTIVKPLPRPASADLADDPFMATMAPGSPNPKGKKAPTGPEQYSFARDVPPEGGVIEFELDKKSADTH